MENWTNFFSFSTPPSVPRTPPPPEMDFLDVSDLLDLENNNATMQFSSPSTKAGEFFNVDGLFADNTDGRCETTQFYSTDGDNVAAVAPAPMISSGGADPFLGNRTAEDRARIEYFTGLLLDAVNLESAPRVPPRDGGVAARNGKAWTVHEHKLFLVGMEIYGKSDWRNIAYKVVMTKTPSQVASHAQKYFLRQNSSAGQKPKRSRSSIHDITTVDPELLLQILIGQHSSPPLCSPLTNYPPPQIMLPHHAQQCQPSNDSVPFIQQQPQPGGAATT